MIKEQNTERTDDKVIAEFDNIEYAWEYCQLKKKETCCLFYIKKYDPSQPASK